MAIAREIREELLVACNVVRPVFLRETFFLHGEKQFHEICVYYEVALASEDATALSSFFTTDGGIELEWAKLDRLADVNLQPPFLRPRLEQLPPTLEHITDRPDL